jgi:signal transduction histidine kinase
MSESAVPPATAPPSVGDSIWFRGLKWWHLGFYVALATVAVIVWVSADAGNPAKASAVAALVLLGAAYPFLTRVNDLHTWKPKLYVVLLIAVVTYLAFLSGAGSIILFIAFPQVWMFAGSERNGVAASALICVLVAAGQLHLFGTGAAGLLAAGLQAVISFLASTLLGLWIYKIIEQSEQRADLIAELNAARAELGAAHERQGAMAERERMAREIHDTLAQGFTSIVMLSEAAQAQLRKTGTPVPAVLASALAGIRDTARDNLQEARALIAASGPTQLAGGDLLGALRRLKATALNGARLTVELPPALPELTPAQQVVVLRAAQEALNNVRRHAGAHSARLRLHLDGASLVLSVDDDGAGFVPGAGTSGDSYGLRAMAERLAGIGGSLDVHSAPGDGTRLTMTIPLQLQGAGHVR